MVRNPHVDNELIEKIFDPDDQELGLDMNARHELACAFLTNEQALDRGQTSYSDWCARVTPDDASGFIDLQRSDRQHYDKLWSLAAKWPSVDLERGIKYWIYRFVGADDKMKAEVYRACKEPALRRAILRNARPPVNPHGSSMPETPLKSEVIKLGLQDSDLECRRLAIERRGPEPEEKKAKYLSYAWSIMWTVVSNAIAILLALKILSSAATSFETITFSILILIYGWVTWIGHSHGLARWEQAVLNARRYLRIIELLKDPLLPESKDSAEESIRQQEAAVRKHGVLMIIQSLGSTAVAVVALYYLVRATL
jgi:hypothetical protein